MSGYHDDRDADLHDDVLDSAGAAAECPLMHDGIPVTGYFRGEPIPDLNALPQERWLEVLRPLSHWPRVHATAALRTQEQVHAAQIVKGTLLTEDGPAPRARAIEGASRPVPQGAPPSRGGARQINFRLGPDELFAMTPTALDRALYAERRGR